MDLEFTWGSVNEASFGRCDPNRLEFIRLCHWKDNRFQKFLDLFFQPADISIRLRWSFINFHGLDARVKLGGKCVQNEIRVLVNPNEVTRLEIFRRNETNEGKEHCLPCRCFDYSAFSLPHGVQILICAI